MSKYILKLTVNNMYLYSIDRADGGYVHAIADVMKAKVFTEGDLEKNRVSIAKAIKQQVGGRVIIERIL